VPATINDPALTQRVATALVKTVARKNVLAGQPIYGQRGFQFVRAGRSEAADYDVLAGATDPAKWKEAQEKGTRLPGPHSSEFAPLPEPAIRTGVKAMTGAATELLHK